MKKIRARPEPGTPTCVFVEVHGEEMTNDPNDYRRFAAECMQIAKEATDPQARASFLDMARAWLSLAEHAEKAARKYRDPAANDLET